MFAKGRRFKSKSECSCSYHIALFKIIALVEVELSSYTNKLFMDERTEGHGAFFFFF